MSHQRLSGTTVAWLPTRPPELGEHGTEILQEIGFDQAGIDRFGQAGILVRPA